MVTTTIEQTLIMGTSSDFDIFEQMRKPVGDVMEPVKPTTDGIKSPKGYLLKIIPTSSQTVFDDLTEIDFCANEKDVDKFVELVKSLELENISPRSIIHIIDLALSLGLVILPQQLSQQAIKIYPDDKEIKKYQKILAPPKIINAKLPPYPPAGLNVKWIKEFRHEYKGKWIALKDGELLASSSTFEGLKSMVEIKKNSHILVTRV